MTTSPIFPLQLVGTSHHSYERLALKCLETSPLHRFVAHSAGGLDTPRNQSHHLRCRHFSDYDTRQPARQGEGEELERTGSGGMGPQQSTCPLHMVRGWPGKAQDAHPTLQWLHSQRHVCFVKGSVLTLSDPQKKKNTLSGTEFQRTKEAQAAIMRQKQEAGEE
jgi:hypothetical protein